MSPAKEVCRYWHKSIIVLSSLAIPVIADARSKQWLPRRRIDSQGAANSCQAAAQLRIQSVKRFAARCQAWVVCISLATLIMITGCGAGASPAAQPALNPVPSITTLSPSSGIAGAPAQTLTMNGTNFLPTSTVTYNGQAHLSTFVSSTQLTISLSAMAPVELRLEPIPS